MVLQPCSEPLGHRLLIFCFFFISQNMPFSKAKNVAFCMDCSLPKKAQTRRLGEQSLAYPLVMYCESRCVPTRSLLWIKVLSGVTAAHPKADISIHTLDPTPSCLFQHLVASVTSQAWIRVRYFKNEPILPIYIYFLKII